MIETLKSRCASVACAITLLVATTADERSALAQTGRKTLMQWSYGTSFEGGADLSEPLVTDRPDFTESSTTVGYGVVQLEAGYTYTEDTDAGSRFRSHTYPEALFRIGALAEWCELRIGWGWADELEVDGGVFDPASGSQDLYLGTKLALTPQEHILPETAVIFQMTVPTGSDDITDGEVLPGINYIYSWEVSECCSTGGQTQFNRALDDETGQPYIEFSQSWTVGQSLTDKIGCYSEWFMFAPDGADTVHNEHYFDGGFTYLVNNNLQLDVRAGLGLNDEADDYFVGTGFSIRR